MTHRRHPRSRSRRLVRPGHWHVQARVERFVEPSLLLLLREGPLHGYELLDRIPELGLEGRLDVGNLYRLLRALEDEGLVRSDRKSTRLNSSHEWISYAVFCLKKKKKAEN